MEQYPALPGPRGLGIPVNHRPRMQSRQKRLCPSGAEVSFLADAVNFAAKRGKKKKHDSRCDGAKAVFRSPDPSCLFFI